jgi:ribosomal protein L37AE/L43A
VIYVRPSGVLGHVMGLKLSRVEHDKVSPELCEVCRKRPAATIVVEFIFACDECAAKIETAIRHA